MIPEATVDDLFATFHERLALTWIAGREGGRRSLARAADPRRRTRAVGHLNPASAPAIQVLGTAELAWLAALPPARHAETLGTLFAGASDLFVVADGHPAPDALSAAAKDHGIALLASPLPAEVLVERLQFDLREMLAERLTLHGVFIEVLGVGVLMTGDSGVGKSELALDLIARGHRLVADDAPEFTRVTPTLVLGSCPQPIGDFLEVRGMGILDVRRMYGDSAVKDAKYLGLIVDLVAAPQRAREQDRLDGANGWREVLGVPIPEVPLYVDPVRNLAVLVEVAVRDHLLRRRGYDAAAELTRRQQALISGDRGKE